MWHISALGLFVCRDFYLKTYVQHVMLYSPPLRCERARMRARTRARSRCPRAGMQSLSTGSSDISSKPEVTPVPIFSTTDKLYRLVYKFILFY